MGQAIGPSCLINNFSIFTPSVCQWLRSIIGNGSWAEDQLTDTQLLLQWKLPSMPMRLAKLRMLYAFYLFRLPLGA
jgi:hypothetical protein